MVKYEKKAEKTIVKYGKGKYTELPMLTQM